VPTQEIYGHPKWASWLGMGNKTRGKTIRENGKSEAKLLEFSSP